MPRFALKDCRLTGPRLAEDGEKEIGRHNEGTVRLVRSPPKLPTWSLKSGTERLLAGVFRTRRPVRLVLDQAAR